MAAIAAYSTSKSSGRRATRSHARWASPPKRAATSAACCESWGSDGTARAGLLALQPAPHARAYLRRRVRQDEVIGDPGGEARRRFLGLHLLGEQHHGHVVPRCP